MRVAGVEVVADRLYVKEVQSILIDRGNPEIVSRNNIHDDLKKRIIGREKEYPWPPSYQKRCITVALQKLGYKKMSKNSQAFIRGN